MDQDENGLVGAEENLNWRYFEEPTKQWHYDWIVERDVPSINHRAITKGVDRVFCWEWTSWNYQPRVSAVAEVAINQSGVNVTTWMEQMERTKRGRNICKIKISWDPLSSPDHRMAGEALQRAGKNNWSIKRYQSRKKRMEARKRWLG